MLVFRRLTPARLRKAGRDASRATLPAVVVQPHAAALAQDLEIAEDSIIEDEILPNRNQPPVYTLAVGSDKHLT
jgi:hypothetical protein